MTDREQTNVFHLTVNEETHEVAYLRLPTYPKNEPLKVSKNIRLVDLIGAYQGPDIILDFDQYDTLVGIEILADGDD